MEYVMVPVPEELVEEVQLFLRWQTDFAKPAAAVPEVALELAGVEALLAGLDEDARALLRLLARPEPGTVPTIDGIAGALGRSPREVVGTVYEANVLLAEAGGLGAMITITPLAEGATVHQRLLALPEPVAVLVHAASEVS
jgi:hypothetical protein